MWPLLILSWFAVWFIALWVVRRKCHRTFDIISVSCHDPALLVQNFLCAVSIRFYISGWAYSNVRTTHSKGYEVAHSSIQSSEHFHNKNCLGHWFIHYILLHLLYDVYCLVWILVCLQYVSLASSQCTTDLMTHKTAGALCIERQYLCYDYCFSVGLPVCSLTVRTTLCSSMAAALPLPTLSLFGYMSKPFLSVWVQQPSCCSVRKMKVISRKWSHSQGPCLTLS